MQANHSTVRIRSQGITLDISHPAPTLKHPAMSSYASFFSAAFPDSRTPYEYQKRLACGERDSQQTAPCESRLINIPTGLGKTAAVVLAWLWNRCRHSQISNSQSQIETAADAWPRRLVYCLPMRTLVEQTHGEVRSWIEKLVSADLIPSTYEKGKPRVIVLMGGETLESDERDWDIFPEQNTIIIGTQDMLLSRALNRGYGMARARWPMHFGLLNNDCLWVLDETQLMGVGVRTSAQLEGLREKVGTAAPSATWWASATLDSRLLETPDHSAIPPQHKLNADDLNAAPVVKRVHAVKHLSPLDLKLTADTSKAKTPYIEALAHEVLSKHKSATLTLVVLNRVDRAQELCSALEKLSKKQSLPPILLVHSRFRPMEREALSATLRDTGPEGRIIISTQAIEAGVDISSRTLVTELAPWSSLVQRFGRCNRNGEWNSEGGADIHWIDLSPEADKDAITLALPYTPEQLTTARELLVQVAKSDEGASPASLSKLFCDEPLAESHILRRKDLLDLFDTTPDLSGLDLDVGRYIRDGEERDVLVFWREFPKDAAHPCETLLPVRSELVRVPAHAFKKFAEKKEHKGHIWRRNPLEGTWETFRNTYHVSPGQTFLISTTCGGYSTLLGWTGEKTKEAFPVLPDNPPSAPANSPRDGQSHDDESQTGFESLAEHTARVVEVCSEKLDVFPDSMTERWRRVLLTAALWHDVGKAHSIFQDFLITGRENHPEFARYQGQLIAKSPWRPGTRFERRHFRHELASALAWLQSSHSADDDLHQNLVAYLIATHHGKVRLSIRAMPGENLPRNADGQPEPDRLYARGIWQGDLLSGEDAPALDLDGIPATFQPLDLSLMRMGETNGSPSWTSRMLTLRDAPNLGIFRLAWLETLLRAADAHASRFLKSQPMPDCVNEPSASYSIRPKLTPEQQKLAQTLAEDGLSIQDRFLPEPHYKMTGKGHFESQTVRDIQHAKRKGGSAF